MESKLKKNRLQTIKNKLQELPNFIILGIAVLLTISLIGSISKIRQVNEKIQKETAVLEKLKKVNSDLQKDIEKSRSQEFIEKQLRDKLGMAREGEIVVILPDPEIVKKFAPVLDKEDELPPDPNWKKWLKLFL